MLAENLENWAKKERLGAEKAKRETARNLITRTEMDDAMIAEIAGLSIDDVARLRAEGRH